MIRDLVQLTLDNVLYSEGVYTFWQRKNEIAEHDEYIVYTQGGDSEEFHVDNETLIKAADITVRYFYRAEKIDTYEGRQLIKSREKTILQAMKLAGFDCPNGAFDAGDIDGIGYFVTVFEFSYGRVVGEN